MLVLKTLVQAHLQTQDTVTNSSSSHSPVQIIADLAGRLDEIKHASARACIVWLAGQFSSVPPDRSTIGVIGVAPWAPDVLRRVAKTFITEVTEILTLRARMLKLRFRTL